ncbi:MAG: DUF4443 domain-containing protein [Candidatus Odinarchaeia archaeon]
MNLQAFLDEFNSILELIAISESGRLGRYTLKNILQLSEGRTRSRLKKLKSEGLIEENAAGAKLSEIGRKTLNEKLNYYKIKKFLSYTGILLGVKKSHYLFQVHIKNIDQNIKFIDLRDEAIRGGAQSTVFIISKGDKLSVPGVYDDVAKNDIETANFIKNTFNVSNGDLIIISSADNKWDALRGALRVVIALNNKIKNI